MLIQALCDYYDLLARENRVVAPDQSPVKIHYRVSLTPEGAVDGIEDWQKTEERPAAKGKTKSVRVPRIVPMFRRTEKPGIESNLIEHRPTYLFGLIRDPKSGALSAADRTDKAVKSHRALTEANLAFVEGIDSPVVNAFRQFLLRWQPEAEQTNPHLLGLGKALDTSGFVFCLAGQPGVMLQDDPQLQTRWQAWQKANEDGDAQPTGQCAITGQTAEIARLHDKISGVTGGLATGTKLVCFNNDSELSYGAEQSLNSNISVGAMRKYTQALNYLLASRAHKTLLSDTTVIHFAMSADPRCDALATSALLGALGAAADNPQAADAATGDAEPPESSAPFSGAVLGDAEVPGSDDVLGDAEPPGSDTLDPRETQKLLQAIYRDAAQGLANAARLLQAQKIDPNVDYYLVGLKANTSRLAVQFLYRCKLGAMVGCAAQHQADLATGERPRPIALWEITQQLVSPKARESKVDPALSAKLLSSVVFGYPYPSSLLATVVRRIRTDRDEEGNARIQFNPVRAGLVKACLNRSARLTGRKEEFGMALDRNNPHPAYLCGRLFAVLERIQTLANPGLNRTITDAYFASASSQPALIFPRLIRLSQAHLKKIDSAPYWNRQIGDIMLALGNAFPEVLSLADQGRFDLGYYQQKFAPNPKKASDSEPKNEPNEEENENGHSAHLPLRDAL